MIDVCITDKHMCKKCRNLKFQNMWIISSAWKCIYSNQYNITGPCWFQFRLNWYSLLRSSIDTSPNVQLQSSALYSKNSHFARVVASFCLSRLLIQLRFLYEWFLKHQCRLQMHSASNMVKKSSQRLCLLAYYKEQAFTCLGQRRYFWNKCRPIFVAHFFLKLA